MQYIAYDVCYISLNLLVFKKLMLMEDKVGCLAYTVLISNYVNNAFLMSSLGNGNQ
jgi:hypothetical protein